MRGESYSSRPRWLEFRLNPLRILEKKQDKDWCSVCRRPWGSDNTVLSICATQVASKREEG